MRIKTFADEAEWMLARRGKITGTRAGELLKKNGEKKIGFYELIAERIATAPDGENPMERGRRLEEEAIIRFRVETGLEVNSDLVMWERDDAVDIAVSPDGSIDEESAVEVKCLSSARHLEAYLTQTIPSEYIAQTRQYFVTNDKLQTLHVIFYDPRIACKDYFTLTVKREDIATDIIQILKEERMTLIEVETIIEMLLENHERN